MLKCKGFPVYYTPCAEIVHFGSQTVDQMPLKMIKGLHDALILFSDTYDYFGSSPLIKGIIRCGVRIRCWLKQAEFYLSKDKRVVKGPGAPKLIRN